MLCDVPVGHPCVPKPPLCHGDGADHQRQRRDAGRPGKTFPVHLQDLLHGGRWDDSVRWYLLSRTYARRMRTLV